MRTIRVEEAVGTVLCHDITRIVPGKFKGRAFQRGHVVTEEDIPELLKLGKKNLYVWDDDEGLVHENDAALRIARAVAGPELALSEVSEGKVNLSACRDGMLDIDEETLFKINMVPDLAVVTRANKKMVRAGEVVAGLRAIPIAIEETYLRQVEQICAAKEVIGIRPSRSLKVGVVTTGFEVYTGLIQDKFGPFLMKKLAEYACEMSRQVILPDDADRITAVILELIADGADLILATGGMSVDPDDVTPRGIKNTGARVVTYGAPVLPGSMMLLAYRNQIPILGLPAGVMFSPTSILDVLLPFLICGVPVTKETVARLGLGGMCLRCQECRYPVCFFGTGV